MYDSVPFNGRADGVIRSRLLVTFTVIMQLFLASSNIEALKSKMQVYETRSTRDGRLSQNFGVNAPPAPRGNVLPQLAEEISFPMVSDLIITVGVVFS